MIYGHANFYDHLKCKLHGQILQKIKFMPPAIPHRKPPHLQPGMLECSPVWAACRRRRKSSLRLCRIPHWQFRAQTDDVTERLSIARRVPYMLALEDVLEISLRHVSVTISREPWLRCHQGMGVYCPNFLVSVWRAEMASPSIRDGPSKVRTGLRAGVRETGISPCNLFCR